MNIGNTSLPASILKRHCAVMGMTGAGKSSKLRVLVEHLLHEQKPVCIVDPKGDWYGLKWAADGKTPGFPVVIFGGQYADIPITEKHGALVAEIVATTNQPAIVDLFGMSVGARTRFFVDFGEAYYRQCRGARHLVVDEVHNFAAKGAVLSVDAGRCLHAMLTIATEGRGRGITLLSASQRPQRVHNDLLDACSTLIAARIIHTASRDAVASWIKGVADPAIGKEVLSTLASLQTPTAWVWSPEMGFGPVRVEFPLFKTFDSFDPESRVTPMPPAAATIDIETIRARFAAAEPGAKNGTAKAAADQQKFITRCKELEAENADLRRQMESMRRQIEEGIRAELDKKAHALAYGLQRVILEAVAAMEPDALPYDALSEGDTLQIKLNLLSADHKPRAVPHVATGSQGAPTPLPAPRRANLPVAEPAPATPPQRRPDRGITSDPLPTGRKPSPQQRILNALSWWVATGAGAPFTKVQVAFVAGYSPRSTSFTNPLGALHAAGKITYPSPGLISLTDAGLAEAATYSVPTTAELHRAITAKLSGPQVRIMQPLLDTYPIGLTNEALASAAGYSVTSTSYTNPRGSLHKLGLIHYLDGRVYAANFLFF